ncbi:uncharacterized protein [Procambarus clarkii]|uniref:uncharacterized protein n=1 Tax=Procambarus clarkii TaxID=6728 RepID=UPI0037447578
MRSTQVLLCLAMAAASTWAAAVPPKVSLSIKDKLALDIPVKQVHENDKTTGKAEVAKVVFPSTTPTTSTTTSHQPPRNPARLSYIDATVFRHQFTTPATTSTTESPNDDYEAYFRLWDDLSSFAGEMGPLGGDLRGEAYIDGFRPPGF